MSAYQETPDKRIRADFALRIGKLFTSYEKTQVSLEPNEQFDATMTVVLLQSLLTTCSELMKNPPYSEFFKKPLVDVPAFWGIRSDMVVRNSFPDQLTHKLVIDRIRHSLSHPSFGDVGNKYPVSGFKNINDNKGKIVAFSFVNSPDIKYEGKVESFKTPDSEHAKKALKTLQDGINKANGNQKLEFVKKPNDKFEIYCEEKPYVRVFQIDIPIVALKSLLLELSNYLSQPIQQGWDGSAINQLVA
jgi:hypothetical protein